MTAIATTATQAPTPMFEENLPEGVIALFWSAAKKHRIGGYVKEAKTAGYIDTPEQDIRFEEHVFQCKIGAEGKRQDKFIRGSRNFGAKECMEVHSFKEANFLTLDQQARKNEVQNVVIPVNAETIEDFGDEGD